MDDQKGPDQPPKLHVVKPKRKIGQITVTREIYEAAEDFWLRKSSRRIKELATHLKPYGVTIKVAQRLVYRGYASLGWASLRDKARLHDLRQEKARARANEQQAVVEENEKARAARDNLLVVRNLRALGMLVAQRVNAIIAATPQVANGVELDDGSTYRKGRALVPAANVLRAVSTSLRDLAASELVWIKETTLDEEAPQAATDLLLSVTSEEWIEFARTGKLPSRLTPEALKEMARMGFAVPTPA